MKYKIKVNPHSGATKDRNLEEISWRGDYQGIMSTTYVDDKSCGIILSSAWTQNKNGKNSYLNKDLGKQLIKLLEVNG